MPRLIKVTGHPVEKAIYINPDGISSIARSESMVTEDYRFKDCTVITMLTGDKFEVWESPSSIVGKIEALE